MATVAWDRHYRVSRAVTRSTAHITYDGERTLCGFGIPSVADKRAQAVHRGEAATVGRPPCAVCRALDAEPAGVIA